MRLATVALLSLGLFTLRADMTYQKPSKEVMDVLHAPASPATSISPVKTHVLMLDRRLYPGIDELAAPMLRLGGLRINPATNGPHTGIRYTGLTVKRIDTGAETRIKVPAGANLGRIRDSLPRHTIPSISY